MTISMTNGQTRVISIDFVDFIDISMSGKEFYVKLAGGSTLRATSIAI